MIWLRKSLSPGWGSGRVGGLKDGITFDITDHVGRWLGRYPEGLMKIQHYLAEKKLFPMEAQEFGKWRHRNLVNGGTGIR